MNRYVNYSFISNKDQSSQITYYVGVKYPEIPFSEKDIYVYTTIGDRLDKLSQQYYGSTEYYWIIATANPDLTMNSLYIPEGSQIRIPGNINEVILNFKTLNNQ
jgi:phage tail protein X